MQQFEKLIQECILEKNNSLHGKQFRFRSKHFVTHALISLAESIKNYLDKYEIVAYL